MSVDGAPWGARPGASRVPTVGRAPGHAPGRAVSVWLIHPDDRPDYYETIFDFAAFVEATRAGAPRLVVWTGRSDLDRVGLRATLRRIVTAEADAARAQLAAGRVEARDDVQARGLGLVLTLAAQGTLLAMRATPAGMAASALIAAAGLVLAGRSAGGAPEDAARLEAEIARVQAATDAALGRMALRLHPELAAAGGDPEAWPLPEAVRRWRDGHA